MLGAYLAVLLEHVAPVKSAVITDRPSMRTCRFPAPFVSTLSLRRHLLLTEATCA